MKKRILHTEASAGWGGQEIRILREAEGMRLRGHEVYFAIMKGGVLAQRAREKGFVVYELDFRRSAWPFSLFKLLAIMGKHQVDIVNTHSSLDGWIGGIAARLSRRKIIRTRHFSTAGKGGMNGRILYGVLADFIVTAGVMAVEPLIRHSGKSPDLVKSVPTGVDPALIDGKAAEGFDLRKSLGIDAGTFLVGTACVMRSWKGIDDFLKAADLLRGQNDIKWVIVGGGHEERYRNLAKELRLEGIVYFTGHLENPFPAIRAFDAFALLSTANEGVPQASLQASYMRKPLIATPTGGLSEVCLHEATGLQVPVFDPSAVAAAAVRLKHDRDFAQRLGSNASDHVLKNYTFQQTLDGMEHAYSAVTNSKC